MGKSKIRTLLMACVMIMLCAAMIVGGTYALWSKDVTVTNHLVAGKLDVKLDRISLTKTYLDDTTGYLVTTEPDTTIVDFSTSTTANVFGLSDSELIVPTSSYAARLKLSNNDDVAFTYDIIIKLTSVSNALAQQLKVYVSEGDGDLVDKGFLSDYATENGAAIISTQTMAKNTAAKEFTIKIEFVNDNSINNNAHSQQAEFDLLVKAVQKTSAQ